MTAADWMAIAAVILGALAILPGSLGVLMYTHKIAASASGARYIYGQALWVLIGSALIMGIAVYQAFAVMGFSPVLLGALIAYGAILAFGFFMHVRLMFKPVRNPTFISLDEAIRRFGPGEEVVGVLDPRGKPFAFVTRLARRPHVVYQPEGNAPFVMTHCILAHSSMAYEMADRFRKPDIVVTAVLANNMVFYEKSNHCSVIQIQNKAREGDLALKTIPTVSVSLGTWQKLYPDSRVWIREREWRDVFYLKLLARAEVIDPDSPIMVYPLQHDLDERLPMKSCVIGVQADGVTKAYPVSVFEQERLIEDQLGGRPLLLLSVNRGDYIQVLDRELEPGRVLTFRPGPSEEVFVDNESGSHWSPTGLCVSGAHKGRRLSLVPHYNKIFWYVWADFVPGSEIFTMARESEAAKSVA